MLGVLGVLLRWDQGLLLLLVPALKLVGGAQRQSLPFVLLVGFGAVMRVGDGAERGHRQARDGVDGSQCDAQCLFGLGKPLFEGVDVGCGYATLSALCIAAGQGCLLTWGTSGPAVGSAGPWGVGRGVGWRTVCGRIWTFWHGRAHMLWD